MSVNMSESYVYNEIHITRLLSGSAFVLDGVLGTVAEAERYLSYPCGAVCPVVTLPPPEIPLPASELDERHLLPPCPYP